MQQRRWLIYLAPALIDMVLAQFFFVNTIRLAHMGLGVSAVAGVVTVWAVVYLVACPLVGRFLTVAKSTRLILTACGLLVALCLLHLGCTSVLEIYVLMGCTGIAAALFFPAFQVFMKAVAASQDKSIAHSTGLYTFAWSMGFAVGPFIAGFLLDHGGMLNANEPDQGWKLAFLFGALASLFVAGLITVLRPLRKDPPLESAAPADAPADETARDYTRMPDLAWLGWLGAGVGVLVLSLVRGVFPARAVGVLDLSAGTQGLLFFLLSLMQACVGLACCRSRTWMYRAGPVLVFGMAGVVGSLCLGYGTTLTALVAGAVLFGLYSGGFFFYLVFHALTHPSRSAHYIAVNESVVGVGGIVGPLMGGMIADRAGFGAAYLAGTVLIVIVVLVQAAVHTAQPVQMRRHLLHSS